MSNRAPIDLLTIANLFKKMPEVGTEAVQATIGNRSRRLATQAALCGNLQLPSRSRKPTTSESIASSFVIPMPLIADSQIESAFRRDPDPERPDLELDPLHLGLGWVKKQVPPMIIDTPKEEFKITPDWLCEYTSWIKKNGYGENCTPIPTLCIPKIVIAGKSTNVDIKFMTDVWGKTHDGIQPQYQIKELQYSNWMLGIDYWEIASLFLPGAQPYWRLNYWPSPLWTAELNWADQQAAIADRKMMPNDAQHQLWFTNLAYTSKLAAPDDNYSRVDTMLSGCPRCVGLWDDGVCLGRGWAPQDANPGVRAAVSGVDWNFGT